MPLAGTAGRKPAAFGVKRPRILADSTWFVEK
jgi:hypothetical protein